MNNSRNVTVRGGIGALDAKFEVQYFYTIDYKTRAELAARILHDWSYITGLNWEAMQVEDMSDMPGSEGYFHFTTLEAPLNNQRRIEFFLERFPDDATS